MSEASSSRSAARCCRAEYWNHPGTSPASSRATSSASPRNQLTRPTGWNPRQPAWAGRGAVSDRRGQELVLRLELAGSVSPAWRRFVPSEGRGAPEWRHSPFAEDGGGAPGSAATACADVDPAPEAALDPNSDSDARRFGAAGGGARTGTGGAGGRRSVEVEGTVGGGCRRLARGAWKRGDRRRVRASGRGTRGHRGRLGAGGGRRLDPGRDHSAVIHSIRKQPFWPVPNAFSPGWTAGSTTRAPTGTAAVRVRREPQKDWSKPSRTT